MLFHWISRIYGWFFHYQKRRFKAILTEHGSELESVESACDVGCGTGRCVPFWLNGESEQPEWIQPKECLP